MVKVGPKLPPPTRRELARIEKEQKRAEQLENGVNPAALGEPRERVIYLFRIRKAAHHPKLEDYELEEARRKREKNHRRALARKMAKAPAEADAGQGSLSCMDLSSDVSMNLDDTGLSKSDGTLVLDSEATPACLSEPSKHSDEISTRSPASLAYPDGYVAMNPLANNMCRDENPSSLSPVLEFGMESNGNLDLPAVFVSAAVDFPTSGLSDSLCTSGSACFASPEAPNLVNEQGSLPSKTGRTDVQTAKTALHPDNAAQSSVLVFPNKSIQEIPFARAKFSRSSSNASRGTLPARSASSKSAIFSQPLDARNYSLKPSSARSSSRSHYQVTLQRRNSPGNAPLGSNSLIKFPEPPASSASNLATASSFCIFPGSVVQPMSQSLKAEPASPTISKGAEGFHKSESFASSGKPRCVGPSGKALFPHFLDIYETKSERALLALSQKIKSDDRLSDGVELTRGINLRPLRVNYPKAVVDKTPTNVSQPRFGDGSIIRSDPQGNRTPPSKFNDAAPGGYSKDENDFSSNNSTTLGTEEKRTESRADQQAIGAENVPFTGDDDPMIAYNLGSISLAPAAPIIQERRPPFDDKFFQQRRGMSVDDLEKGVLDPQTPTRFPRLGATAMKCPDSPLDTRSGIVAPASTPVSRSPLLFAIALPSPPWSRSTILPTHVCDANSNTEEGGFGGLVLALKWMIKKTLDYFWQRRG